MQKIALHSDIRFRETFVLILAVLLVGLISITGWFTWLQNSVFVLASPLLRIHTQVVSVLTFPVKSIFSGVNKEERMLHLAAEVSQLHARVAELEHLEQENTALRHTLETSERTQTNTIVTAPIVSLAYPAVGVGSTAGVIEGAMVVINGTLVGLVSNVSTQQAQVTLLTNQATHSVLARTESGVEGILMGDGKTVRLEQIPRELEVSEGERVFTLGQPGVKKNMFIGKVVRVEAAETAPTKSATIEQYVSFYDAILVEIW